MKKIFLSIALVLFALTSVTTFSSFDTKAVLLKKANAHWVTSPCLSGNVIKGKIAGLGNGDITITVSGQFSCTNPAQHDPNPWQDFTRTKVDQVAKNGNYNLSYDLKLCNRNWTLTFQNVTITVAQGGTVIEALTVSNVPTCQ